MKKHHTIIIAGAGGIAEAVGLLLVEWSDLTPSLFIGDLMLSHAQKVAQWIQNGATKSSSVHGFHLPEEGLTDEMKTIFQKGDILLDCLPGSEAPKMARFAKDFQMHYANLTECVAETEEIKILAKDAKTGFVLQTGLAPGYINLIAYELFQQFCRDFKVDKVDTLEMRVGALTLHAVAPHYYGYTWSPMGVATEYLKDSITIRDFKKTVLPPLSERSTILIDGFSFEEDLTSGGAADLPDALAGKVRSLDYKTLRHPGHYDWVQKQIRRLGNTTNAVKKLQEKMEVFIPHNEDDQVVMYAAVTGKDSKGILRRREISKCILPQKIGKCQLRAIQTTTAAPLAQAAQMLLETPQKGVILQSQIEPLSFLNGTYVLPVYGKIKTD